MQYHDAQKTAMDIELQVILYTHVGGSGATTYGNHVKNDARVTFTCIVIVSNSNLFICNCDFIMLPRMNLFGPEIS